jgi:hypothetical protein
MKRVISYILLAILLVFWLALGAVAATLKQIQIPFTRAIEFLDKIINKLNVQS